MNNQDNVQLRSVICQLGEGKRQVVHRSADSIISMNRFSAGPVGDKRLKELAQHPPCVHDVLLEACTVRWILLFN